MARRPIILGQLAPANWPGWPRLVGKGGLRPISLQDSLAEWSKALASGASPQGRGFEPHSCHLYLPDPTNTE